MYIVYYYLYLYYYLKLPGPSPFLVARVRPTHHCNSWHKGTEHQIVNTKVMKIKTISWVVWITDIKKEIRPRPQRPPVLQWYFLKKMSWPALLFYCLSDWLFGWWLLPQTFGSSQLFWYQAASMVASRSQLRIGPFYGAILECGDDVTTIERPQRPPR